MRKRDKLLKDNAFRTVNRYEPARVQAVRKKRGAAAAERMKTAIALDEARKQGVKIPRA